MPLGRISRILTRQGIGFIEADASTEECEFHWTAVQAGNLEQMKVGMRVEFNRQVDHRNRGRFRAINVRLVEPEA